MWLDLDEDFIEEQPRLEKPIYKARDLETTHVLMACISTSRIISHLFQSNCVPQWCWILWSHVTCDKSIVEANTLISLLMLKRSDLNILETRTFNYSVWLQIDRKESVVLVFYYKKLINIRILILFVKTLFIKIL